MNWITGLFFFLTSINLFSQQAPMMEYGTVSHFNWGMFKGKINLKHLDEMGDNTQAVTVSSLRYATQQITPASATVTVVAEFDPNTSWTRYPDMLRQEVSLDHERRHFDITEIYARKIRKAIASLHFTPANFNTVLNNLFKDLASQHQAEQNKYDHETRHSMDAVQQQKWNQWIDEHLEALSAYSKPTFIVNFSR